MDSPDGTTGTERRVRYPVGASVTLDQLTDDLHPTLARLRKAEPVSWLPAIGGWLVTDYDVAVGVLREPERFTVDDERFTTGQVVGASMLSTEGADHSKHRQPFEAMFRRGVVLGATEAVERRAVDLIKEFVTDGQAELRTRYAAPLAVSVIARFLGFHDDCLTDSAVEGVNRRLLASYRTIVDTVVGLGTGQADPDDAAEAITDLGDLLDNASTGDGPLAALVNDGMSHSHAVDDGALSPDQLRSNVAVILFGAIETCEGTTANAISHVLGQSSVLERVRSGSVDVDRVVNESLRLEPAAAVVDRYATASTVIATKADPVAIGAAELVEVSLAAANRDPAVFADPNRFDPDRPRIGHHLAFARGPHVCLGLHLARLQTAVALKVLVRDLPNVILDKSRSTPPRGHIFRKPDQVVVHW